MTGDDGSASRLRVTAAAPPRRSRQASRLRGRAAAQPRRATGSTRKPLTLAGLRGKVVLVDFWTYSCINCLRTLPHLESWYRDLPPRRVRDHRRPHARSSPSSTSPRTSRAAVKRLGIDYPVVQDNNYGTWTNYSNQYWPAHYLIDRQGRIRDYHYGEGGYATTEAAISTLLGVSDRRGRGRRHDPDGGSRRRSPTSATSGSTRRATSARRSPEPRSHAYRGAVSLPGERTSRTRATGGSRGERIVAGRDAGLTLHFRAKNVYLVLGGHGRRVGVAVGGGARRAPCTSTPTSSTRCAARGRSTSARLDLRFTPGVQAYAFTFG